MQIDIETPIARDARILIIDDRPDRITGLARMLQRDGYAICISITDPGRVVGQFSQIQPDLVLMGWHMAPVGGKELLRLLKKHVSAEDLPPVLVLTADDSPETKREALAAGVADFLSNPLDHPEALLRIRNLLQLRRLQLQARSANQLLADKVKERTEELEEKVAELKEAQQRVIQQERLRALGVMAAGIAHDFNGVLTIIKGYSEMFLQEEKLRSDETKVREAFGRILAAAGDAGESVRRLREFYRSPDETEANRRPVDLNEIVREAVLLSSPRWQTHAQARSLNIELNTELQNDLPLIFAAPSELREAVINLLFNAVDAMPRGGRISLRTSADEGSVTLEVEDSGNGMTEDVRLHCLEPFFTTKDHSGAGLGLAAVYGTVRRHGGDIRIHAAVNQGTRISLALPIKDADPAHTVEPVPEYVPERFLKVLVVDNQHEICDLMRSYLELDAHSVVTASNGREALKRFRGGAFDVVITDLAMPDMSGVQLARAIKKINPAEPVILFTGYQSSLEDQPDAIDLMLNKPASLRRIREAISKAVALSGNPHPGIGGF